MESNKNVSQKLVLKTISTVKVEITGEWDNETSGGQMTVTNHDATPKKQETVSIATNVCDSNCCKYCHKSPCIVLDLYNEMCE